MASESSASGLKEARRIGTAHKVGAFGERLPDYKEVVLEFDLEKTLQELSEGAVPEGSPWLKPYLERSGEGLISAINELQNAQDLPERDHLYEAQVVALTEILFTSTDENMNDLGFCANIQDKRGNQTWFQYTGFRIGPDLRWAIEDMYGRHMPLAGVDKVVPR